MFAWPMFECILCVFSQGTDLEKSRKEISALKAFTFMQKPAVIALYPSKKYELACISTRMLVLRTLMIFWVVSVIQLAPFSH